MFFIIVGFLIALNFGLYLHRRLPFNLFIVGFMSGLFVAKILVLSGY